MWTNIQEKLKLCSGPLSCDQSCHISLFSIFYPQSVISEKTKIFAAFVRSLVDFLHPALGEMKTLTQTERRKICSWSPHLHLSVPEKPVRWHQRETVFSPGMKVFLGKELPVFTPQLRCDCDGGGLVSGPGPWLENKNGTLRLHTFNPCVWLLWTPSFERRFKMAENKTRFVICDSWMILSRGEAREWKNGGTACTYWGHVHLNSNSNDFLLRK